jgi:hypothetical protein
LPECAQETVMVRPELCATCAVGTSGTVVIVSIGSIEEKSLSLLSVPAFHART